MSVRELGSYEVDPFDSIPVTKDPLVESPLRFCMMGILRIPPIRRSFNYAYRSQADVLLITCAVLTGFDLNLTTVDPCSAWFPYAMQSSASMHATLALAAAFWSAKAPSIAAPIQREGLRQKGETMRQVMAQLTRRDFAPSSMTYRLLLASISTLANVEVLYLFHFGRSNTPTKAEHAPMFYRHLTETFMRLLSTSERFMP